MKPWMFYVFILCSVLLIAFAIAEAPNNNKQELYQFDGFCDIVYLEVNNPAYTRPFTVYTKNDESSYSYNSFKEAIVKVEEELRNCSDPFDQYEGAIFLFDDTTPEYECLDVWNREKPIGRFCPQITESEEYVFMYEAI